jgi:predicted Zn-dependent peptidase
VAREHIAMLAGGPSEQDPLRFAADVLTTVIGDRTGSRFYWALVDKGLVEDAAMSHRGLDGAGLFEIYVNAPPERAAEAVRVVQSILDEVRRNGVTAAELAAAKVKHASAEVVAAETPRGRLFPLGGNWLYRREYRRPADDLAALEAVSAADIRAVLDRFGFDDLSITCLGPLEQVDMG